MLGRILEAFGDSALSLWGPFGLLILCGFGLPVPEDILLIAAGFLGADDNRSVWGVMVMMYVGILVGDTLIYAMGRVFGRRVLGTRLGRFVITEERLEKAEFYFRKYGKGVVFVGRFLPGLRAPVFFSAGLLRFSLNGFLVMDGFAALISAPAFVWVGHWAYGRYSEHLDFLEKTLGRTKFYLGLGAVAVAAVVFYVIRHRNREEEKQENSLL